jgi:hypothetical protein
MLTDSFVLIVETKLLRIMKEENIYKVWALCFVTFLKKIFISKFWKCSFLPHIF